MSAPASSSPYCQFVKDSAEPRSWMVNSGPGAPYMITHTLYSCPRCLRVVTHITGCLNEESLESYVARTVHVLGPCAGAANPMKDHSRTKRVTRSEANGVRKPVDIGVATHKAKMTPGKNRDLMVEIFEDIPSEQLGVKGSSGKQ